MDPSYLRAEQERFRAELLLERDPSTRRELKKTIRHLGRQFRKATSHRHPWHGLFWPSALLTLLLLAIFASLSGIAKKFGLGVVLGVTLSALLSFVLITGIVLLVKGFLSQETYKVLVNSAIQALPRTSPVQDALPSPPPTYLSKEDHLS